MDTNLCTLAYQREATWGVTPASPALAQARFTSETMQHDKTTVVSAEIRPDRQVSDIVKVSASAKGDISFELNFSDFQHWIEAAVMGNLSPVEIGGVTCDLELTSQTIEANAGTFAAVVPGCTIKVAGAATPANNGLKQVVAKSADGSAITLAAGSITTTEAAALIITGTHLKNGVTAHSYFLERKVPAATGGFAFQRFLGMQPDSFELNFESKAIVTGKIGFVGSISAAADASLAGESAIAQPSSDTPVNATNNVGTIQRDGATMSEKFKKLTLQIANNLRGRDAIGTEGNISLGVGTFDLTGSMECYFRDNSLLASVIDHDDTSIGYRVTDDQGNIIVILIPRLVFASGNASVSAKDTDVMVPLDIRALRHAAYDATVLFSFIPA